MRTGWIIIAAVSLVGCNKAPQNAEVAAKPRSHISPADNARLAKLTSKYREVRMKLRASDLPDDYLSLQQDKYVIEEEIKRIEPLDFAFLTAEENRQDEAFRQRENTRRADQIAKAP